MMQADLQTKNMDVNEKHTEDVVTTISNIDNLDERRLRAQGHKAELARSFSWLGALGLAYRRVLTSD